jgi:hypothetical protein
MNRIVLARLEGCDWLVSMLERCGFTEGDELRVLVVFDEVRIVELLTATFPRAGPLWTITAGQPWSQPRAWLSEPEPEPEPLPEPP